MKRKIIAAATSTLAITGAVWATVINVPASQPTIQAGVNAASDGDTVLVAKGHYFENINFRGKRIVLAIGFIFNGSTGDIDSTIIDGSQPVHPDTASCVLIYRPSAADSTDTAAALVGFTLTNGRGTVWADKYVPGSSNVEGGGLLIENCSPRIRHNRIFGNTALIKGACFDGAGGGIKVTDGRPEVSNNIIALNRSSDHAGGVLLWHAGAIIRNNVITRNRAGGSWGGGGGICIDQCQGRGVVLINNSIAINQGGPGNGGGMHVWSSDPVIENCIIWGNQSQQVYNQGGSPAICFSDVQGGFTGVGNLDADPLWSEDLLYLGAGSPCIDAGNDSACYCDPEDGGSPGQALWPSQGTLRNDMGTYGGPGRSTLGGLPPYIIDTSPHDGQNRIAFDSPLWVAFSQPMEPGSLSLSLSDPGIVLSWSWNGGHDTLSLSHVQNFANFTRYWLKIAAGQGAAGEPLAPLPDSFSFRTLDTARPKLSSTQPANGQTGVATNAYIRLWFSKPVDKNTLAYAFSDTSIHFTTYQTNDSVLTLIHATTPYAGGTAYTFEVLGVQDTCGNAMNASLVPNPFSFTTAGSGVEGEPGRLGRRTALEVFPNPSDGSSEIVFSVNLASAGQANLSVYDVSGRKVAALFDGRLDPGTHWIKWNERVAGGGRIGAGCYFCLLRLPEGEAVRRLVISR